MGSGGVSQGARFPLRKLVVLLGGLVLLAAAVQADAQALEHEVKAA